MYESALSLAMATIIVTVIWEFLHKGTTIITPLAVLISSALLSHGERFDSTGSASILSEGTWVVEVHAVIAWMAFGVLALSNFLALRIVLGRTEGEDLERPLVTTLRLGFLLLTAMIVSGSATRLMVSGTPWSFDPVESMALVVWMAYASPSLDALLRRLARQTFGGMDSWSLCIIGHLLPSTCVFPRREHLPYLRHGSTDPHRFPVTQ